MVLSPFEFLEKFILDNFFMKLTQFGKTWSIHKDIISKIESITFSVIFPLMLFDNGVYFPFNNENALNLEKRITQTVKIKIKLQQRLRFFPEKSNKTKNYQNLYKRLHFIHYS